MDQGLGEERRRGKVWIKTMVNAAGIKIGDVKQISRALRNS